MGAIGVVVVWACPPAALGGRALAPVDKSLVMLGSKAPHGAPNLAWAPPMQPCTPKGRTKLLVVVAGTKSALLLAVDANASHKECTFFAPRCLFAVKFGPWPPFPPQNMGCAHGPKNGAKRALQRAINALLVACAGMQSYGESIVWWHMRTNLWA